MRIIKVLIIDLLRYLVALLLFWLSTYWLLPPALYHRGGLYVWFIFFWISAFFLTVEMINSAVFKLPLKKRIQIYLFYNCFIYFVLLYQLTTVGFDNYLLLKSFAYFLPVIGLNLLILYYFRSSYSSRL